MWSSGGTGVAQLVAHSTLDRCVIGSSPTRGTEHFGFPPVLRDWEIKGLGMSSLYATGHIKDPVPLIEKRRGLSPGGRFPPSFIHQVIISHPKDGLRCRQGVKPSLKLKQKKNRKTAIPSNSVSDNPISDFMCFHRSVTGVGNCQCSNLERVELVV